MDEHGEQAESSVGADSEQRVDVLREQLRCARAAQQRLELIAASTGDHLIIELDPQARIIGWNLGAHRAFGYPDKEIQQRPLGLLLADEPPQTLLAELSDLPHGESRDSEHWYMNQQGARFHASLRVSPLYDERGLQGFIAIGQDSTERRRREEEQADRNQRSREDARLKDEFFAMMSHELKHPLNLIQLNAELISRLSTVKSHAIAARASQAILAAVRSQGRLIDDLLDLSRLNTGKLRLNPEAVSLPPLIDELVDAVHEDAYARDIAIEVDTQAIERPVHGDPLRIEQIVWNLLNNALKFTPGGGTVSLRLTQDGEQLRLDVSDDGQGIAAEDLQRIFELFDQLPDQRLAGNREGLGIGLALVRQLAEAHGGHVSVHSAGLGQGSTFSVWLPLQPQGEALEATGEPRDGALHGLRILLVDDSAEVREGLQALLEIEGAVVHAVGNARDALLASATLDFDLLLSDLYMPGMDGLQMIRLLRQQPRGQALAAIALSGYGGSREVEEALAAGFDEHLDKPISFELLERVARRLCRGSH